MPAYIRSATRGNLRLTLSSDGDVIDSQLAATPREANKIAIMMLAGRDELNHGDTLTCRHETQPATVLRGPGGER